MKLRFSSSLILSILAVLGFMIYSPVFQAPFVFDDYEFVVNNPLARNASILFSQWHSAGLKLVTYLTFVCNFMAGGQDPFGYHLVNIILHIINAWLLFILAGKILRAPQLEERFDQWQKEWIPVMASVLFLVHPVATSAVNYVWQRAELLTALFYLSALIFYLKARLDKKFLYYAASIVCFFIGIFAKGTIISLPLVIILLECALWQVSRRKGYTIILTIGAIFFFKAYLLLWEFWALYERWFALPFMRLTGMLLTDEYLWTQYYVTVKYLGLALLPLNQNFDYDIPLAVSYWEPHICLSALILSSLIAFSFMVWNRWRLLSVGILWFLICLLPAALMGGREPMWEYRMYLPLTGFVLGMVATAFQIFSRRKILWVIFAVILIFSGLAFSRNLLWRSPESLLLDNIRKSPQKPNPYQLLGAWYLSQGRVEEAESYLEKTIALAPDAAESYNNLGLIAKNRGDTEKAQRMFETAIHFRPTLTGAYINLAYLELNKGQDRQAEELLRQSLQVQETEGAYAALGKVFIARGKLNEAEDFLKKSLLLNPAASQAYFWYGELFAARQETQKARVMYQQAVQINPRLINLVPADFR